jgi:IS1 family transposase
MNKLPLAKRVLILNMLVEGSSLRSISRVADVSINTVTKLLEDAGETCLAMHDELVRGVKSERIQADEIWSFCYAKQRNLANVKASPEYAGDVWTWTALDADTKLMVSYFVGDRSGQSAAIFMDDLRERVSSERLQITTDGHSAYLRAVDDAFGIDADYAMIDKIYKSDTKLGQARYSPPICAGTKKKVIEGNPDPAHISTSYAERANLSIRMQNRRFTRLTNAFSKKLDNHIHALALYFAFYNFVRIHKTLKVTPAMAAGISDKLWSMEDIAERIEANRPQPKAGKRGPRGPYKPRAKLDLAN